MQANVNARREYAQIKKQLKELGKGNARLTASSLFLEQNISAQQRDYTFPVLQSDNNPAPFPTEIRLNINDEFIITELGVYLVATVETTGGPASNILLTYAPSEIGGAGTNNYILNRLWQGKLKIDVNNVTYVENWDLQRHHVIPRTQFQDTSAGIPASLFPNINTETDGIVQMVPMITLSGAKKNNITINLPQPLDVPSFSTWTNQDGLALRITFNRIALLMRGWLAQNASKFQGVGAPK